MTVPWGIAGPVGTRSELTNMPLLWLRGREVPEWAGIRSLGAGSRAHETERRLKWVGRGLSEPYVEAMINLQVRRESATGPEEFEPFRV